MVKLSSVSGIAGLPADVKATGRTVDFKPDEFTLAIESKGNRLAWSRASYCPCRGDNDQTEQPGINCDICEGSGWLMFAPARVVNNKEVGKFDAIQTQIISSATAGVIFGVETALFGKSNPYDQVVRRIEGQKNLTVRPENRLGYWDQIINLDTTIVYSQVADADGTAVLKVRFPIVCMNLLRSETQTFVEGTDFNTLDGNINWIGTPPAKDTRVALHYLTYPHWRVIEYPHMTRATLVSAKTKKPDTPLGNPTDLPIQAICKLEFLLDP